MKTKNLTPVVSNPPTPATIIPGGFTLGLDLGDRSHHVCVLDAAGQIVREGALSNTRPALAKLLAEFPRATVAMEAGTHSPWISRYLTELGAHVLVANPRRASTPSRVTNASATGATPGCSPGWPAWIPRCSIPSNTARLKARRARLSAQRQAMPRWLSKPSKYPMNRMRK